MKSNMRFALAQTKTIDRLTPASQEFSVKTSYLQPQILSILTSSTPQRPTEKYSKPESENFKQQLKHLQNFIL